MRISVLAPIALVVAASPALADEPYAVTPSGRTESIFDLSVVETSDKIANGCADVGWTLVNTTSTMVVCEARLSTMQSVLAALALGNAYSTPPKQFLRFNIAGLGRSSRVQATGWMETQMAFGQTRTQEMTAANYHNNVMNFFQNLGGRFPPGTSFPNHAYLGTGWGSYDPKTGLTIASVEPGSPAERAGVLPGDILVRIAREKIKSPDDILDGLRNAAKAPTFDLEVRRGGKLQKLSVATEHRAEVTGPALANLAPEPGPDAPTQAVLPLSPADELAKFAKLHEAGILSDEEFAKQKAKLLGSD
jgi:membrane-associated protease RseP (regulator of RpoE activity)